MKKFGVVEMKGGNDPYCKKLKNTVNGGNLHDKHLHSGLFNTEMISTIKK
jgi:hypothetical protein